MVTRVGIPVGANKRITRVNWGRRSPWELPTALTHLWESKRPSTWKESVHGQEGSEKALISHSG